MYDEGDKYIESKFDRRFHSLLKPPMHDKAVLIDYIVK